MPDDSPHAAPSNPFSTRFVRPGALAYRFADGATTSELVQRLAAAGWRGQIVGPHGSGKSTLLASLLPTIEQAGRRVAHCALHEGQRRVPTDFPPDDVLAAGGMLVVDGYEQLGWPARWRLAWLCRRYGCGLLVTVHRPVRLPLLYQTNVSREATLELVAALLPAGDTTITSQDVDAAYDRHGPNVRDILFHLYDLYERRNRSRQ